MKRVELAGVIVAAVFAVTACGGGQSAKDVDVSSSDSGASVSWEKTTTEDASVAASTGGSVSVDVRKNDDELQPLHIEDVGIYVHSPSTGADSVYVDYCGVITNPNLNVAVTFPTFQITLENTDGTILATDTQTGMYIMPGDTVVLSSLFSVPIAGLSSDTKVEYMVNASDAVSPESLNIPSSSDLEITNVSEQHTDWDTVVTGKITNNYTSGCDMVALTALFKSEGEIIGMETTYLDNLPAGGTMAFEIDGRGDLPEHDTVEVYAQYW